VPEDRLRLTELVIDVHHQDQIERIGRELRIGRLAQDRGDVRDLGPRHSGAQQIEHALLDIGGIHTPGRTDQAGEAFGEIPRTGADIRHGLTGLHVQQFEGL
jgi:hypothetical protein